MIKFVSRLHGLADSMLMRTTPVGTLGRLLVSATSMVIAGSALPAAAAPGAPVARVFAWDNPITAGLNGYGQKDVHILADAGNWYLVATEMRVPAQEKRGLVLYRSSDLVHWREAALLFDRETIPADAWYRDEWLAPEIHQLNGKYFALFHCRNNRQRPYRLPGFGLAVADRIEGPYRNLTPDRPLYWGNNTNLFAAPDGRIHLYWDRDGRIYSAELDLEKGALKTEPREILGPATLGKQFRFLDAPFVTERNGRYYMITSSFYAGYIIRVRYLTAPSADGPWSMAAEPLLTFIESEADSTLRMSYPPGYSFAPPTQVIFHHQIFRGPGGLDYLAYHSSEKYSEPHLVIEPIQFDGAGGLVVPAPKRPHHSVSLP
jgi:beta-xylosidase